MFWCWEVVLSWRVSSTRDSASCSNCACVKGRGLRWQGIMFWRWDAVNTVNLGQGDSALTIGISSTPFQARARPTLHADEHSSCWGAFIELRAHVRRGFFPLQLAGIALPPAAPAQ